MPTTQGQAPISVAPVVGSSLIIKSQLIQPTPPGAWHGPFYALPQVFSDALRAPYSMHMSSQEVRGS